MKLFQETLIDNLPDCYKKDKGSNNYKLLELSKKNVDAFRECLISIENSLNLNNARGATLDLYGKLVGQSRGLATDEQYILLIKTRIMRNLANGSNKGVVDALCAILNCKQSQVHITDTDNPCEVLITVPLGSIIEAELTVKQFNQLVKSILPVGVVLSANTIYEGTFEFSAAENEQDETAGFCDVEGGTIGGYFGALISEENETVLPI